MSRNTGTGINFVRRIYPPRIFGMALGFPAVAMVFYQQQAPWHFWLFAAFSAFIWPHIAYQVSSRSSQPTLAEYRNIISDSVIVGLTIPLMSFSLLPSLVLLSMVSLANVAIGGWRLYLKGLGFTLVAIIISGVWVAYISPEVRVLLEPDLPILLASIPVLVIFPLSIGVMSFSLSRRLAHQREELERISRTDGLSQLNNRRYWEELVYREYERHKRSNSQLSLIMIDIDRFKEVNDKYGHVAGDKMIREISGLLADAVRNIDVVGRYGGEEFGILLPDTDAEGAMVFAERLRLAVQSLKIKPYGVRCTISLGVAEADPGVKKYRQLIERADRALYVAKNEGRNISKAYSED
jgi:diguanylate cyclase